MSHAMYTALSGAVAEERNLEVIADNLANVATPGFKGSRLSFEQLVAAQPGVDPSTSAHLQVAVSRSDTDLTQGAIKPTGNALDIALRGPGYFVVTGEQGERLTRQGSFIHANDGTLRTQDGKTVMGQSGPITARPDLPLSIDSSGTVMSDGIYVDQIRRVYAQGPSLVREGNSTWRASEGSALQELLTPVEVGALEQSNVNAVTAMTQMINTQRHYEMYHRALESVRGIEQKTSDQLG